MSLNHGRTLRHCENVTVRRSSSATQPQPIGITMLELVVGIVPLLAVVAIFPVVRLVSTVVSAVTIFSDTASFSWSERDVFFVPPVSSPMASLLAVVNDKVGVGSRRDMYGSQLCSDLPSFERKNTTAAKLQLDDWCVRGVRFSRCSAILLARQSVISIPGPTQMAQRLVRYSFFFSRRIDN